VQNQPVPAVISPFVAPPAVEQSARPSQSEGAESKPAGEPDRKNGPVIYQKER
jgi:hypothetical protein